MRDAWHIILFDLKEKYQNLGQFGKKIQTIYFYTRCDFFFDVTRYGGPTSDRYIYNYIYGDYLDPIN